jgi:hypothetical protein
MTQPGKAGIEDLWKSLPSVFFLIGLYKNDPPQADLKYSIFNPLIVVSLQ